VAAEKDSTGTKARMFSTGTLRLVTSKTPLLTEDTVGAALSISSFCSGLMQRHPRSRQRPLWAALRQLYATPKDKAEKLEPGCDGRGSINSVGIGGESG
jgi:hypothetical protein